MAMTSHGVSSTETTNSSGTTVMCANALEVRANSLAMVLNYVLLSLIHPSTPDSFNLLTNHPPNISDFNGARHHWHHCAHLRPPVPPVWEAAARTLSQDLWGQEVSSWCSSLASVPADPGNWFLRTLQPHLWRDPHRVVLGADGCSLHVIYFVFLTGSGADYICMMCKGAKTLFVTEKMAWRCVWCWEEWTSRRTRCTIRSSRLRGPLCTRVTIRLPLLYIMMLVRLQCNSVCYTVHLLILFLLFVYTLFIPL